MKFHIMKNNPKLLFNFKSTHTDRFYHFREQNLLTIELYNLEKIIQKLECIHQNPCTDKWKLCSVPKDYNYCNCNFYSNGIDKFNFFNTY